MKKTVRNAFFLLFAIQFFTFGAAAEDNPGNESLFTAFAEDGSTLFARNGEIHVGDEYISKDNTLYRIVQVNGAQAKADRIGTELMPDVGWLSTGEVQAVFSSLEPFVAASSSDNHQKKLIAMYVTHSDESYITGDGTESIEGQGGIYDIAREFRDSLNARGIDVILDESTHLPHDSGAYRRSRRTAERLLQKKPDAIIDVHRDGIPDESEYTCTIHGQKASQVRLLVGRGNQNSAVNREFAKQIKAVADKKYPDLIKDIFIGKGTYNQDLSPNSILLEFGTHTISKERVLQSTDVMADVVSEALYGDTRGSAKSNEESVKTDTAMKDKESFSGMTFMIIALIAGIILFTLAQTGGGKAMQTKIGRGMREITGGLIGKKDKESDNSNKK